MQKQYIRFSDTELERANSIDLASFLQNRGEQLKRIGRDYKLIYRDSTGTHDSITIRGNKWYDHKAQEGGGTIKFMQRYYNLYFHEAVQMLIGNSVGTEHTQQTRTYITPKPEPLKEFKLPSANENMRRVFAYLTKVRHIDADVLSHFAHEHKIYEDRDFHNVVFVGYDESGIAKQAHKRSTLSYGTSLGAASAFRQTVGGSDTRYSFNHIGTSNRVYVFEAPIDMLSFLSLYKQNWKEHNYITLNGTYENALTHFLETRTSINQIYLCTDNDEGGIDAVDRLTDILHEKGYENVYRIAPEYKDWNECLKAQHGIEAEQAVPHKRKELYYRTVEKLNPISINMEKLPQILWSLYKQEQYQNLAETALFACAFYSKKLNPDRDCFSDLKHCLIRDYRAYKDKGKTTTKAYELNKAMQNVIKDMKNNYVKSSSQLSETARFLYCTVNCALSCAVETEIDLKQEIVPQPREPTLEMSM